MKLVGHPDAIRAEIARLRNLIGLLETDLAYAEWQYRTFDQQRFHMGFRMFTIGQQTIGMCAGPEDENGRFWVAVGLVPESSIALTRRECSWLGTVEITRQRGQRYFGGFGMGVVPRPVFEAIRSEYNVKGMKR